MSNNWYKKSLVVSIVVLFIGVTFASSSANIIKTNSITKDEFTLTPLKSGNTLYVGGSGEGNYTKIQDAIDNATNGDTVFVYDDSSPYYENVVVGKSINLIGEDRNTTIIDAGGSGSVVRLKTNYINVSDFTMQNSGNRPEAESGVEVSRMSAQSDFCTITDNIIRNNWDGIHSVFSDECLISGNIIMNNRNNGIYLRACCYDYNISYNILNNNTESGIITYEDGHFIFRNIVENNSNGIVTFNKAVENIVKNNEYGIITSWSSKIYKNIVTNNNIGIFTEWGYVNEVKYNNLFNNKRHASFKDFFMFFLFGFVNPFKLTKWNGNYYEGHVSGPKIIRGTLVYGFISKFNIPWINIEWFPSYEPNDLDWLEEVTISKIRI
jgi:parallel beta-helix repeat protein